MDHRVSAGAPRRRLAVAVAAAAVALLLASAVARAETAYVEQVSGIDVVDLSFAPDAALWFTGGPRSAKGGKIYRMDLATRAVQEIGGEALEITARGGVDGQAPPASRSAGVWVTQSTGEWYELWESDGKRAWLRRPHPSMAIGGAYAYLIGLGQEQADLGRPVQHWDKVCHGGKKGSKKCSWVWNFRAPAAAVRVARADTFFARVDAKGDIWVDYSRLPGSATDIDIDFSGRIWVTGTDKGSAGHVYRLAPNRQSWELVASDMVGTRISVSPSGQPCVRGTTGKIFCRFVKP